MLIRGVHTDEPKGRADATALMRLVQDARRFIMYHKVAIERCPLQTYASALLFSPANSLVRELYRHEEPEGIAIRPVMAESWSACLQTLEGHSSTVNSVAFSPDSTWLASASSDYTVKVWDARSGACLQTLEDHRHFVNSVAFSPDSTRLASASSDYTVKVWDASSGACLLRLEVGKALFELSFDSTGSCLYTDTGSIAITTSVVSGTVDLAEPKHPQFRGACVSSDRMWVMYSGQNMLWIPSEYRPSRLLVCGTTIGIGTASGRVWICSIDLKHNS
jgi:WD40 repeat protein